MMTNKEAIEHLKNINRRYPCSLDSTFRDECEQIAINLAIKVLEEQELADGKWLDNFRDREKLLDDLRPKGKWIKVEMVKDFWWHYECDKCHERPLVDRLADHEDVLSDYCPNCGAIMLKGGAE